MQDALIQYVLLALLAIGLLVAAFTDMRSRQIANWLNGAIALGAPLFWWARHLPLLPDGVAETSISVQLGIGLAAFIILALLFAIRAMGGGDVKLLTALALWIPPAQFLNLLIVMALVGGVLTIVLGSWHVMRRQRERLAVPYGVAIATGGLWALGSWVLGSNYLPAAGASLG